MLSILGKLYIYISIGVQIVSNKYRECGDLLPELGDLLLRLLPSKLAVHIESIKHGDLLLQNRSFHRF